MCSTNRLIPGKPEVNTAPTGLIAAHLLLHILGYKKLPSHPRKVSVHSASPKAQLIQ